MNKIVKIEKKQNLPVIDWNKPQYLICDDDTLVYCTGKHKGKSFNGVVLSGLEDPHFYEVWDKSAFRPLSKGEIVTVQFSND